MYYSCITQWHGAIGMQISDIWDRKIDVLKWSNQNSNITVTHTIISRYTMHSCTVKMLTYENIVIKFSMSAHSRD